MSTVAEAQSLSILAVGAAAGMTAVASMVKGKPPHFRIVVGAGVAAGVLVAAAQAAPDLVHSFAVLVLITALLTSGAYLAGPLVKYLNPPARKGALA